GDREDQDQGDDRQPQVGGDVHTVGERPPHAFPATRPNTAPTAAPITAITNAIAVSVSTDWLEVNPTARSTPLTTSARTTSAHNPASGTRMSGACTTP
ncbi:MAG: hypothetical protein JO155_11320, partial [Acidimicrobiia bacterium]|nr:hypothetical protein [Acidimicrobiia bacterium]